MKYAWLNRKEYPFEGKYIDISKQQLHYIDEGEGEVILFVHGTPSWSFDFRNVIKQLSGKYRCIAIDHIGFGLSSKPQNYDYSTLNHSQNLKQFVLSLGLKNITLVVHDFGGPIGLNFAINYPGLVDKVVVLNSWLRSSVGDPDYAKFSKILRNPLMPLLYRYLNFSARFILPASFGDNKLSKHLLSHFTKPFANSTEREGTLAFAKSLLNDQQWFQQLWESREAIKDKPMLFIWGMKDRVIKPHYLEKFQSGFTNTKTFRLESAGHFPQEEQPLKVAQAIHDFIVKDHLH